MPNLVEPSLGLGIVMFLLATLAIGFVGARLTVVADRLADQTGLGEAVTGSLLLGASTSLPGSVATVVTSWEGHAEFAISHALGGIAIQTAFLAVADVVYRRANLEHAAASTANIVNALILVVLLAIMLLAMLGPSVVVWGVHPASPVLVGTYLFGLRLARESTDDPMWRPRRTELTRLDEPDAAADGERPATLWARFVGLAIVVGVAGWVLSRASITIVEDAALSATVVGGLLTTVSTSLPELVTTIAAVRRGALTLAVGGIIGGNAFDTLFATMADVAYRGGSVYHAATDRQALQASLCILLTAIVLIGLVRREERGIASIGLESVAILVVFAAGSAVLVAGG